MKEQSNKEIQDVGHSASTATSVLQITQPINNSSTNTKVDQSMYHINFTISSLWSIYFIFKDINVRTEITEECRRFCAARQLSKPASWFRWTKRFKAKNIKCIMPQIINKTKEGLQSIEYSSKKMSLIPCGCILFLLNGYYAPPSINVNYASRRVICVFMTRAPLWLVALWNMLRCRPALCNGNVELHNTHDTAS